MRVEEITTELELCRERDEKASAAGAEAEGEWLARVHKRKHTEQRIAEAKATLAECEATPELLNLADPLGRTAAWLHAEMIQARYTFKCLFQTMDNLKHAL